MAWGNIYILTVIVMTASGPTIKKTVKEDMNIIQLENYMTDNGEMEKKLAKGFINMHMMIYMTESGSKVKSMEKGK